MSTKTLRKRIALVAVSALTAGLVSVVAVPSANATAIPGGITIGANDVAGATLSATSGSAKSAGLIGVTTNSTASIDAVMYSWGTLSGAVDALASGAAYVTVTGGYFSANNGSATPNAARTKITGAATTAFGFYATPTGVGTMVLQSFNASDVLVSTATVVVTATNATGTYSAADSTVYWGAGGGSDTATTDGTSSNSTKANGGVCAGDIKIKDAYTNFIANSTGVVTATVTGGGLVYLGSASTAGTTNVAFSSTTSANIPFNVRQATANVPATLSVVIKYNDTVVATKVCKIKGEVAKVTVSSPKNGKSGSANTAAATITYLDAAGNTVYPTSGTASVSTTLGTVITAVSVGTYPDSTPTAGALTVTCSAVGGTQKGLQVKHTNASGSTVLSNTWDQTCADVPYTVTAAWNKTSYAPGSIATLTLTFKDVDGNLANAYDVVGQSGAAAIMTVTGGPSAAAVTPIAATDKPSYATGAVTYDYVVGTTEGDFVAIIVPTEVKENNSLATNISLPYSVKAASGSVTNADVLKAIVSLIASINKQIAALQKALLKK